MGVLVRCGYDPPRDWAPGSGLPRFTSSSLTRSTRPWSFTGASIGTGRPSCAISSSAHGRRRTACSSRRERTLRHRCSCSTRATGFYGLRLAADIAAWPAGQACAARRSLSRGVRAPLSGTRSVTPGGSARGGGRRRSPGRHVATRACPRRPARPPRHAARELVAARNGRSGRGEHRARRRAPRAAWHTGRLHPARTRVGAQRQALGAPCEAVIPSGCRAVGDPAARLGAYPGQRFRLMPNLR